MEFTPPVPGPVTDTFIPAREYRDPLWNAVNKGMKSRGFAGAMLNPLQEGSISNFHRVLRRYVDAD